MSVNLGIPKPAVDAFDRLQAALVAVQADHLAIPCRLDPESWDGTDPELAEYAANMCRQCKVRIECAQYADAAKERSGIWGGRNRGRQTAAIQPNLFEESA